MRFYSPLLRLCTLCTFLLIVLSSGMSSAQDYANLFFLHHSTGRYLIEEGNMRGELSVYNTRHSTDFELWDHDYNYIGLSDPYGNLLGYSYQIPGDNTDPDGLHNLWTTDNNARQQILSNHQVIAFKSCYPASSIETQAELEQYMEWYLEMRDFFDQQPDKIFVVMSPPPRHRLATDLTEADNARAFANWLGSSEYLSGHTNLRYFNLFDNLAHPDDGSDTRNMLRWEYEKSHTGSDSHPNELANQTVGPVFMNALCMAGQVSASGVQDELPPSVFLSQNAPNPFNPLTLIAFELPTAAHVNLDIHDLQGRLLRTLVAGPREAGRHTVEWDGRDQQGHLLGSGIYVYRVSAGDHTETRKMILAK